MMKQGKVYHVEYDESRTAEGQDSSKIVVARDARHAERIVRAFHAPRRVYNVDALEVDDLTYVGGFAGRVQLNPERLTYSRRRRRAS